MKTTILTLSALLLYALSNPAHADQCQIISKEQAMAAMERINIGESVQRWCEPCDEKASKTVKVTALEMRSGESGWEVAINGEPIDLAYTFVKSANEEFAYVNLALLANCPASDVSMAKQVEP
jgi:hypothetical protein